MSAGRRPACLDLGPLRLPLHAPCSPDPRPASCPSPCPSPPPRLRVTLSIFPGVLAEDLFSARLGDWYPVLLIALYNVADWAGKALAGRPALRMT